MKKVINIGVDLETLSLLPTAAIISIAAKEFSLEAGDSEEHWAQFKVNINATSCILSGYHIEEETCRWWSEREQEAKESVLNGNPQTIRYGLKMFRDWVLDTKESHKADAVHVWMQGTDFDGSILRYALRKEFPELGRDALPWRHADLRDARTYILEGIRLLHGDLEDPYSAIPKPEHPFSKHSAMGDVDQMIWNVQHVYHSLKQKINQ